MAKFRIALSGDFVKADGKPAFPMFDLAPLRNDANVELGYVAPVDGVMPAAGANHKRWNAGGRGLFSCSWQL